MRVLYCVAPWSWQTPQFGGWMDITYIMKYIHILTQFKRDPCNNPLEP